MTKCKLVIEGNNTEIAQETNARVERNSIKSESAKCMYTSAYKGSMRVFEENAELVDIQIAHDGNN